ncbi:hypothetical protein [Nocardia sp. BMG51109]|uniref:terpene synthase family protein n=1 Tax=Nocardia sp. BMG51109 TaxID=1056816 RepID=UPI0004668288|nr:hypothetical protein [Nocardia sp. BMG51109]
MGGSPTGGTAGDVLCPFAFASAAELAERVDEHVLGWTGRIGLFPGQADEVSAFHLGTFAAMVHPDARNEDRLRLAAENIAAAFGIDDHYCDEEIEGATPERAGARLAGVLNALETQPGSGTDRHVERSVRGDPVTAAVREVVRHASTVASPAQLGRLRRETTAMCLAMAGEKSWQTTGYTPTPSEYLAQRRFNGAISCFALIDVVAGYELPAPTYDDPDVRALTLAASSLIIHVNDLYSAAKESATGSDAYNLPALLAIHHGWPVERGIRETIAIHNRGMRRYLRQERTVARTASPELSRYLGGLRNWMRGSLEWHRISGRHHNRDSRPATEENAPSSVDSSPLA